MANRLGIRGVRKGIRRAYYSQGVGAVKLAEQYARKKQPRRSQLWANRSEQSWKKFFRVDSNWFNAYLFYGEALGLQGRTAEMRKAFTSAQRIAGRKLTSKMIRSFTQDFEDLIPLSFSTSP